MALALAELPKLEAVELATCEVSVAAIQALPERLRHFSVTSCPDADASVFGAMQRFRGLQSLGLDRFDRELWFHVTAETVPIGPAETATAIAAMPAQEPIARMQAELLRQLPLRRFAYACPFPSPVLTAIGAMAHLRDVTLQWAGPFEVASVAKVETLQRLRLAHGMFELEDLRPLAKHPSLEHLRLEWRWWTPTALAAGLPGVTISTNQR
ncbi:MAG: hypothetical protein ABIP94_20190 [Planctomycetota bacterium]